MKKCMTILGVVIIGAIIGASIAMAFSTGGAAARSSKIRRIKAAMQGGETCLRRIKSEDPEYIAGFSAAVSTHSKIEFLTEAPNTVPLFVLPSASWYVLAQGAQQGHHPVPILGRQPGSGVHQTGPVHEQPHCVSRVERVPNSRNCRASWARSRSIETKRSRE